MLMTVDSTSELLSTSDNATAGWISVVDNVTVIISNFSVSDNVEKSMLNPDAGLAVEEADTGMIAGIAIAAVIAFLSVAACVGYVVYRHFLHRNLTSMNFDNPVYRKTTEDQFSLEKNQFQPQRIYPATVGEEAQEPLTSPGTNDYV